MYHPISSSTFSIVFLFVLPLATLWKNLEFWSPSLIQLTLDLCNHKTSSFLTKAESLFTMLLATIIVSAVWGANCSFSNYFLHLIISFGTSLKHFSLHLDNSWIHPAMLRARPSIRDGIGLVQACWTTLRQLSFYSQWASNRKILLGRNYPFRCLLINQSM